MITIVLMMGRLYLLSKQPGTVLRMTALWRSLMLSLTLALMQQLCRWSTFNKLEHGEQTASG